MLLTINTVIKIRIPMSKLIAPYSLCLPSTASYLQNSDWLCIGLYKYNNIKEVKDLRCAFAK